MPILLAACLAVMALLWLLLDAGTELDETLELEELELKTLELEEDELELEEFATRELNELELSMAVLLIWLLEPPFDEPPPHAVKVHRLSK